MKMFKPFYVSFFLVLTIVQFSVLSAEDAARPMVGIPEDTEAATSAKYRLMNDFSPELCPIPQGGQACAAVRNEKESNENQLVIDCEFLAKTQPEYLSVGTPLFVKRPGFSVGVRLKVEVLDEKDGSWSEEKFPVNIRFVDPSGEWHQSACCETSGEWMLAPAAGSNLCWSGDGDKKLQFPCAVEFLVVDHPNPPRPMKCRVTLYDVRLFRNQDVPKILSFIQMTTENQKENQNTTKVENQTENLPGLTNVFFEGSAPEKVSFQVAKQPGFEEKNVHVNFVRILNGQKIEQKTYSNEEFQKFTEGTAFTLPISTQIGFESLIFTPEIQDEDGMTIVGEPVRFSYAVTSKNEALNSWFGICTHYCYSWDLRTMDFLPAGGFGFLRDEFGWGRCEKEKGKYVFYPEWETYVNRANDLGIQPLVILDFANDNYDGGDFPHTEEGIAGFAGFCGAAAEHFRGRVKYYEIWNEWTGGCGMRDFLKNGHNTPENYVRMIAAASKAIRDADPDAYIIGGGGDHHTAHFTQIEAMMKLGLMKYCDAFSVHPYVYQRTPENAQVREDLQKVIDCMRANGCENPKLWLTELGWPTHRVVKNQAEGVRSNESAVREEYEAQMFVRSSVIYRSLPEVEAFFWYDLKNDGTNLSYNENNFGIIHNDAWNFQPKSAYSAAAVVTQMLRDAQSVAKNEELSNENLSVYEILGPNHSRIVVAWALGDTPAEIAFLKDVKLQKVVGLYGQNLPKETRQIGAQPVYFVFE